jgi:GNAT superfamily N-acetyltransferase
MIDLKTKISNSLDDRERKAVMDIWNAQYPSQIAYVRDADFDAYLNGLSDLNHLLLVDDAGGIHGWAFSFTRDEQRWFAIILSDHVKGRGTGRKLLEMLKAREPHLNGWVIDHDNDKRMDGANYISPLGFYEKCGFDILREIRLETPKLSAVKINWTKKNINDTT